MLVIHTAADIVRILADAHGSQSIDLIEKHLIEKQSCETSGHYPHGSLTKFVCSAKAM